jgi:hypothetical protein
MKLVRFSLSALAVVVVLLALVAAVALTPPVQQWAVRRALAGQTGWQLQFAHLAAGPSRAEATEVIFERRGLRVRLPRAEVEYSLWRYLFQRRVVITRLVASGLELDLSKTTSAPSASQAAGAPAAAPGAIAQIRLPWEIVVGTVDLGGHVLLPGATGKPAIPVKFSLTGGGLAPGQEGLLRFRADFADTTPGARVTALRTAGELRVRETHQRNFDHAHLQLTIDAEGAQFAGPSRLRLNARLDTIATGANYTLAIDTLQGAAVENLLTLEATAPTREPVFTGRWAAHARRAQIEPFFLGDALPQFSLAGAGTFTVRADNADAAAQGELQLSAANLEALDPALRALGAVNVEVRFDAAAERTALRLNHLTLRVAGERPVATLEIKRPVAFEPRTRGVQLAVGDDEVGRLQVHGLPLAWVRPFVHTIDVSGGLVTGEFVVAGGAGELHVRTVTPLRVAGLNLVRDGRLWLDRADVSAAPSLSLQPGRVQVAWREVLLTTPAGDRLRADLEAEVALGQKAPPVDLRLRAEADLPRLLAPWAPVGPVRSRLSTDLSLTPGRVDVRAFRGEMLDPAGRALITASASRAFAVDLHRLMPTADGTGEVEIGRLTHTELSLADLPLVSALFPVAGQVAEGGFVAAVKGSRFYLRPIAPLRVSALSFGAAGQPGFDRLAAQTTPTLEYGGLLDWKISDGATAVHDRTGATLGEFNAELSASARGLGANLSFNVDLAAAGRQPALRSLGRLSAGRASGEIRGIALAGAAQLEVRSTVNGLVAREGNQTLPIANLSARFTREPNGRLTFEAPLLLDRTGVRSDLRVTASGEPQAGVVNFTARAASEHLELGDALALAGLLLGGDGAAPVPGDAAAPRRLDARPPWARLRGDAQLEFKEVVRGKDWTMRNFTAVARVDPEKVELTKATATFNEKGVFTAEGTAAFRGGAQPYAVSGDFSVTEFDVGRFLKALEPDKAPVLEGVFAVKGRVAGEGTDLQQAAERMRGDVALQGRAGVFRGLRRTSEKLSVATKAVELGSVLGSFLGGKVKDAADKVAPQSYQVDQLAQALGEIGYDQFVVRATRDAQLHVKVDEVTLLAPEIHFTARGGLTHVEGRPLLEQPMRLAFQLAARGKVEQTLGKLRALDGTKDDLGYARAKDLGAIGGTPLRPQPDELFQKLAESKLFDLFK